MLVEFDIETAKLAMAVGSGRVVTRLGQDVCIIKWDDSDPDYPIQGKIIGLNGDDSLFPPPITTWTINGKYYGDYRESKLDLFIEELC
jgi:hypothetical protein